MTPLRSAARRRLDRVALVVAAGAVLITFGCSSDGGPTLSPTTAKTAPTGPPAATGVDPCALLSADQIDAATGWTVEAGTPDPDAAETAGAVCNWERPDREGAVHLQFHDHGGTALFTERRQGFDGRGPTRAPHPVTLTGADDAFDVAAEGLLGLRVGDDYIQVTVIGGETGIDDHLQLGTDIVAAL